MIRRTPSGKYFVSILMEQEIQSIQPSLFEVGIDVGLSDFATLSDGTKIKNPKWLRRTRKKVNQIPKNSFKKRTWQFKLV